MERGIHRFMNTALLIGCGQKNSKNIVQACEDADYKVINIGSTGTHKIHWNNLNITELHKILTQIEDKIDFVFFNQNGSTLNPNDFANTIDTLDLWEKIKAWQHSYWLSSQLPFFVVKTLGNKLTKEAKLGWMLSSYINKSKEGVETYPDYSGNKYTNYTIMKSFNNTTFDCFGISPDFSGTGSTHSLYEIIKEICYGKICDGEVFNIG